MDKKKDPPHPMQPLVMDGEVVRFKPNKIVQTLLDFGREGKKIDLNDIAMMNFPREDREQFSQLIGYSVSGWGDLSYVSNESYAAAAVEVKKLLNAKKRT